VTTPERRGRARKHTGGEPIQLNAAARLAQVSVIWKNYVEILEPFNDMKMDIVDLDEGTHLRAEVEDPEFGYQMLGIVRSLLGALEPLLTLTLGSARRPRNP
jgi:hypothetical protein